RRPEMIGARVALPVDAEEDAGATARRRVGAARVLDALPCALEHHSMARIDVGRLVGGAEEARVELFRGVEESGPPRLRRAGLSARRREARGVGGAFEEPPEFFRVRHAA